MKHYTVNVEGDQRHIAKSLGLHSYYANGVTAIEVEAKDKRQARPILVRHGLIVLYVFE